MFYKLSTPYEQDKAREYLEKLITSGSEIELKKKVKRRTNKQNAYLHAILSIMALESGNNRDDEEVYTVEEMKTKLKRENGRYYEKNGDKFIQSSKDMTKGEMTTFIEFIRNKAATQDPAILIMSPEEYYTNGHELDEYIERNRAYL